MTDALMRYQTANRHSQAQILSAMRVRTYRNPTGQQGVDAIHCAAGDKHVYSIGAAQRRLAIASQQTRATNLACALAAELNRPGSTFVAGGKEPSVLVLGAGLSGTTCATALAYLGCKVILRERQDACFSVFGVDQRAAAPRPLFPHYLEWPFFDQKMSWLTNQAKLPLFSWVSGKQINELVADWRQELECHRQELGSALRIVLSHTDPVVIRGNQAGTLSLDNPIERTQLFDAVIFALGPGLETFDGAHGNGVSSTLSNLREAGMLRSYWTSSPVISNISKTHELCPWNIFGDGDGAIADLVLAALAPGDHWTRMLRILAIEESRRPDFGAAARRLEEDEDYESLLKEYQTLANSDLFVASLDQYLQDNAVAREARPKLFVRGGNPYNRKTAPINRLILFHLICGELIEYFVDVDLENFGQKIEHVGKGAAKFSARGKVHEGGIMVRFGPSHPAHQTVEGLGVPNVYDDWQFFESQARVDRTPPAVDSWFEGG